MSEWRYELTPLTPLHIAAGDTIEPFEYVIYEGRLYKFDTEAFLLALTPDEQNRFVDLAGTNLIEARKFLSERGDLVKQIAEYSVPVSTTAAAYYEQRLSNPQSDLSIGVFIRTNHRAYIPGSSLKGALRTALLYQRTPKPIYGNDARKIEAKFFHYENPGDDPFKYFKISDSNVRDGMTQLMAVNVNTKRADGWSKGEIPLLREVTWGALMNHAKAREVTVTFSVLVDEIVARYARRTEAAKEFGREKILAACRAFYGEHLKQEAAFHQEDESSSVFYQALQDWEKQLPKDTCLVRLGWGSGFDAVTVRYARKDAKDISTPRPSRKKKGKT
jgi:CRISPR-associated protein Csm5